MGQTQSAIPLEYASPPPRGRPWWKIPADAILDVAVAAGTIPVNLALWGEAMAVESGLHRSLDYWMVGLGSRPPVNGLALALLLISLDAFASMLWGVVLLYSAVALATRFRYPAAVMHRVYAR